MSHSLKSHRIIRYNFFYKEVIQITLITLIDEIKSGDTSQMGVLIEQVRPVTLSMIKKYGYYDSFEENYHNAMVQLLEAVQEFDISKQVPFAAFYKKKLFYFYMEVIKEQADKIEFVEMMPTFDNLKDENLIEQDKSLDKIIWRENTEDIQRALLKLTPRQQWFIREHFYKGKKVQQIAKENDLHPQTVTKLKARALGALRAQLRNENLQFRIN